MEDTLVPRLSPPPVFEERRRGLGWRIASSPGSLLPPFLRREPGDEARWRIREREKEERKGGGGDEDKIMVLKCFTYC